MSSTTRGIPSTPNRPDAASRLNPSPPRVSLSSCRLQPCGGPYQRNCSLVHSSLFLTNGSTSRVLSNSIASSSVGQRPNLPKKATFGKLYVCSSLRGTAISFFSPKTLLP